jgi:cytochrome P450
MSSEPHTVETAPPFDALNPYPWFAWMRQHERVYQGPGTHSWYVFGYHDVLRVLNPPIKPTAQDPIIFSVQLPERAERYLAKNGIIFTDPPRQRAVREVLNPAFSPRALKDLYAARITSIIDGLLDQVIGAEETDVVASLVYSIPVLVISEMLGVPRADRETFQQWAAQAVGLARVEGASFVSRVPEMEEYFWQAIAQRRQQPPGEASDLVSVLVHGCPHDGVALSPDELLGNCETLLLGGFETTAHLLTNLFRVLDAFPEVQEQVWQNPALVSPLIEETLRYFSPLHFIMHRTTREVELCGKVIPENQMIMPLLSSANRDEEVFDHPETFDLMRFAQAAPNHVAFGFRGTHFCLGAPLARLEASLTMQRLIARMEQIRLVPGTPLKPRHSTIGMLPVMNGVQSLPVTFKRR